MNTKKLTIATIIAALLGVGIYEAYQLGLRHGAQELPITAKNDDPTSEQTNTAHNRKILYWHDPMVPAQKFDKPGKSPYMDMDLEPVYADSDNNNDDNSQITVSPRIQQNLGIRIAEVTQGKLAPTLSVVGNVAYNERDVVLVQARANGFIEKLYVRAPLDPVKKGQALAELYVPDWVAAQEEFLTVKKMGAAVSTDLLDGARQRMRLVGMSDEQIRRVETLGAPQARLTLYAPIGGVITELSAREGMTVMAGAPLFRINGTSSVWVNAEVPENMAAQVRSGSLVEARTQALPDTLFKGRVSALLPQVDATTRTLQARIELANPAGMLVPGMFINVDFSSPNKNEGSVLMVPSEAIIQTGQRTVVIVVQADGKFEPVEVRTGMEQQAMTTITQGLHAGQKVVISGQFLIDSEASLRGTITRMSDASMPKADTAMASTPIYHGRGKVEAIGKNEITLSHDAIPELNWGAMTMPFKLPASGLSQNIKVGETVLFDLQLTKDGDYQITDIHLDTVHVNKPPSDTKMKNMTGVQ